MWQFTIILKIYFNDALKVGIFDILSRLSSSAREIHAEPLSRHFTKRSGANLKCKKLRGPSAAVYPKSLQMVCRPYLFECGPFGGRNHPEETRRPRFLFLLFGSLVNNNLRRNTEEYFLSIKGLCFSRRGFVRCKMLLNFCIINFTVKNSK